MSTRAAALIFALFAIALTLAQDVVPARDWYHGWQYATLLVLCAIVVAGYAWPARTGADGVVGKRLALALAGALIVAGSGLAAGLIGPDTVTVVGTPGTVTPVPDLGAAAFFPAADPDTLARGDSIVTLRRPGAAPVTVGARPVPLGLAVVFTENRPAAYVVARDASGSRLTVTQPANASFLSPVVLFRQAQTIHDRNLPMDSFAVPAAHRLVRVLYFTAADLAAFRPDAADAASGPRAVLSTTDDAGTPDGIALAQSGRETAIGPLRLIVVLGSYPVLLIAAAPQPFVLLGGLALFVLGCGWALVKAPLRPADNPIGSGSALR